MLLALGVMWAGWIISYLNIIPFINFIGPSPMIFSMIAGFALFLTIGIPILGLMLLITRWFSNYRIPKQWRLQMRLVWVLAFVVTILSGIATSIGFSNEADISESTSYEIDGDLVKISELELPIYKSSRYLNLNLGNLEYTQSGLVNKNIHFDVKRSENDQITVETKVHAHGKSYQDAHELAQNVSISHHLDGNDLKIPKSFLIKRGTKFRAQSVHYIIYLPEGKNIGFDDEMADIIWDHGYFRDGIRPKNLENYTWTMTDKGLVSENWEKEYRAEKLIEVQSLENLNIDGRVHVSIEYGDVAEVRLSGPKSEIEKIEKVETAGTTSLIVNEWPSNQVQFYIKTPKLIHFQGKDLRSIKIEGFKQDSMELNFSGFRRETEIKAYVDVKNLTCTIGGAKETTLLGSGENLVLNILDGSRVIAEQYKTKAVAVKGNIYSNSTFYASDSFDCPKHERHNITLFGNPALLTEMTDIE